MTLFAGSARYYRAGRFPYPAELADAFREELGLDGRGRLLDVGCGTGEIAILLAPLYEEVVGLDAQPEMIEEARRRGRANTRWVHARAEELPLDLGAFRTATFAQSFHWLERERVAATVLEMLEPGGAWVHVDTKTHRGVATDAPLGRPQPLRDEIDELVARYLGPTRRGGPSGEAEIMLAAGFAGPRHRRVTPERVLDRTEDEVVASVFAVSGSAPPLFGPRLAEFESELRKLLRSAAPDGRFRELAPPVELIVWTKPAR